MINYDYDHLIDSSLRAEPEYRLPDGFSQRVTGRIKGQTEWKNNLSEYLNIAALLLVLLVIATFSYYLIDKSLFTSIISSLSRNSIVVGTVIFLLNFVFFADRVILPFLFNKWKRTEN